MSYKELVQEIEYQRLRKEDKPEFTVGEQLLEMARNQPELAELLAEDLAVPEMNLTAAAAEIRKYADEKHKKSGGKCVCVTPKEAETVLREFYHLPEADAATDSRPPAGFTAPIVDLADFL